MGAEGASRRVWRGAGAVGIGRDQRRGPRCTTAILVRFTGVVRGGLDR